MKITLFLEDETRRTFSTDSVLEVLNQVHAADVVKFEIDGDITPHEALVGPKPHLVQVGFVIRTSAMIHQEIAAVWNILDDDQKNTYLLMTDQDAESQWMQGAIDYNDFQLLETLDLTPFEEWNNR